MTNQEINERVAKLCGWEKCICGDENCGAWFSNVGNEPSLGVPNYTKSLDACGEFEEMVEMSSDQEIQNYVMDLEAAAKATGSGWNWRAFRLARATPLQRCEAFLRLKGQWE